MIRGTHTLISRSSLLLGRYPHNTGYVANSDQASTAAFLKQANHTTGKWLTDAGYYTAFFGKYVNGCEGSVPSGWSYWGGLIDTYNFYNATVWEMDWEDPAFGPPKERVMTDVHQADFLANFTVAHAQKAVASGCDDVGTLFFPFFDVDFLFGPFFLTSFIQDTAPFPPPFFLARTSAPTCYPMLIGCRLALVIQCDDQSAASRLNGAKTAFLHLGDAGDAALGHVYGIFDIILTRVSIGKWRCAT